MKIKVLKNPLNGIKTINLENNLTGVTFVAIKNSNIRLDFQTSDWRFTNWTQKIMNERTKENQNTIKTSIESVLQKVYKNILCNNSSLDWTILKILSQTILGELKCMLNRGIVENANA